MKKKRAAIDNPVGIVGTNLLLVVLSVAVMVMAFALPLLLSDKEKRTIGDLKTEYRVGTLADRDVIASETFFYVDEVSTRERQQQAAAAVLPRFTSSLAKSMAVIDVVDQVFASETEGKADSLMKAAGLDDAMVDMQAFFALTPDRKALVKAVVRETVVELLEHGIYIEKELEYVRNSGYSSVQTYDPIDGLGAGLKTMGLESALTRSTIGDELVDLVQQYGSALSVSESVLALDLIAAFIQPNMTYDALGTSIARKQASEGISPATVKIEKGQYVIKQDFVITAKDVRSLQALVLASAHYSFLEIVGMIFFVVIVTLSALYLMRLLFANSIRRDVYVMLFLGGMLLTQLATYLILRSFVASDLPTVDPFLPVLIVPIMLAIVTNRKRAGYIAAVLSGSYSVLLPDANIMTIFFITGACFCGIHFIKYVSRRIDMLFQWFFGIVATAFLVVVDNLLSGHGFDSLLILVAISSLNITATYILVTVMLPLIERIFNVPTPFRLRELAYGDSPLLTRLAQNAQGTYNHVQAVADLAFTAAKAIGADALLARVGALYHDVGKLDHPEYFMENQDGDNKHDDLKASLSVAIIKSHVKLGFEKGKAAGLPVEVLDIISQHHGNDVIALFLKEAQDEAQTSGRSQVKIEDYMYPSVPPQTPEAAIVMLADSVEAASRSIRKPSVQKYEKLIHQIVMGKIDRKQLNASRLSFTDLDTIVASFIQTLAGKFHTRLEYPGSTGEDDNP